MKYYGKALFRFLIHSNYRLALTNRRSCDIFLTALPHQSEGMKHLLCNNYVHYFVDHGTIGNICAALRETAKDIQNDEVGTEVLLHKAFVLSQSNNISTRNFQICLLVSVNDVHLIFVALAHGIR